ncbi:PTB domain-containing adapter protein ced-6 isoform X2 [Sitodiplosis mosellana]|uniref:PTB domain-containing adapter protein ced-6 isoform X2 n=1 Tax=Sitodiplosis mosellana TaxID=263140 RepID=UPI0024449869|nr:PTB domain-containing adapter protein ced-6 isoform X2 [Sitodiplosis mosellana]XP_055321533.1 PTB domain-containing adapter protein ced-6 isoform X2 [Sitodiplosis mosellana]XP_055321534.1 PTB domain-containing adapter protein ced-6 isoform X2 [Sitodiplosis mosellana]
MSTLMFWNKQNGNANQNGSENGSTGKNGKKTWLHTPESLMNGHVAYLVKFLGCTPVDQAKGIETVKDAIRRLQFSQQMKKAESGSNIKTKKVEITISVDGVAIQEPRGTNILHQFPLHNISYCADEKGVKKFFSFIAKNSAPTNGNDSSDRPAEETHECFVFISSKLASDITLTIGQAFELAYSGKTTEVAKLQSQNKYLEQKVEAYCQRLKDLADVVSKGELDRLLMRYGVRDILDLPQQENGIGNHVANINGSNTPDLGIDVSSPNNDDQLLIETSDKHFAPIVPPRNLQSQISSTLDALKPSVGTKLEGLLLNSDSDSDFDPRADENDMFSPEKNSSESFFGFEPPKTTMGQQLFTMNSNSMMNGGSINGNLNNGAAKTTPLLAPPPKASIPRRNGNVTSNQDLFGSTPFDAHSSPFDVRNEEAVSDNSLPTTLGSVFNSTANAFTLHDDSSFENVLHQSSKSSTRSNPFNDSVSVFSEPSPMKSTSFTVSPKKEFEFLSTNNENLNAIFSSYGRAVAASNKSDMTNGSGELNQEFGAKKNPFSANEKTTWNELNALDLNKLQMEFNSSGNMSGIFASANINQEQSDAKMDVMKKEIPVDLFKDVANELFSEFKAPRQKNNEFFNKISGFDAVRT